MVTSEVRGPQAKGFGSVLNLKKRNQVEPRGLVEAGDPGKDNAAPTTEALGHQSLEARARGRDLNQKVARCVGWKDKQRYWVLSDETQFRRCCK